MDVVVVYGNDLLRLARMIHELRQVDCRAALATLPPAQHRGEAEREGASGASGGRWGRRRSRSPRRRKRAGVVGGGEAERSEGVAGWEAGTEGPRFGNPPRVSITVD